MKPNRITNVVLGLASLLSTACGTGSKYSSEIDSLIATNPKVLELRQAIKDNKIKQKALELTQDSFERALDSTIGVIKFNNGIKHGYIPPSYKQ